MSPIKNFTTEIDVGKTVGEIQTFLARRGVRTIGTTYTEEGLADGLTFSMQTEYGLRDFRLPVRIEGVLAAMQRDAKVPASKRTPEQAARVAWRIAKDWLEAQAAVIDAGLAQMDEVFLPWMLTPDGQNTVYSSLRNQLVGRELGARIDMDL